MVKKNKGKKGALCGPNWAEMTIGVLLGPLEITWVSSDPLYCRRGSHQYSGISSHLPLVTLLGNFRKCLLYLIYIKKNCLPISLLERSSIKNMFFLQSFTYSITNSLTNFFFVCLLSSKRTDIEFSLSSKSYFYAKYYYVCCVFSMSLIQSGCHGCNRTTFWLITFGNRFFQDIYEIQNILMS